jgi:nitroreductase
MKMELIRILPKPIIDLAKVLKRSGFLIANYLYDFWRYSRFSSSVFRGNSEEKMRALITIHYHSIEKGLSLRNPRPSFGSNAIKELIYYLDLYLKNYGPASHLSVPLNVLRCYVDYNHSHGVDNSELEERVAKLEQIYQNALGSLPLGGGVRKLTREEVMDAIRDVSANFFLKRYSIRQFTDEDVSMELIEEAVRRAQKTPAVCNRQSCRVRVVSGKDKVKQILDIQKGARGFGNLTNKVLVITSDLCNFTSVGERYQSYIDGGLFSMSLIYALHSLGLGSCCLNWSMGCMRDIELKRFLKMSQSETIIMLLAVGMLPEELMVAESCRKPLAEVLVKVE